MRQPEGPGEREAEHVFEASTAEHAPLSGVLQPEESEPAEALLFQSFSQPEFRPPVRMPHLGHVAMLGVFLIFGLLCASILIFTALHFHLFGVANQQEAAAEIHYALGSEAVLYLFTLGASLLFFPLIWGKGLFAGLQWNGAAAFRLRHRLFVIAAVCCALALVNGLLLPGPKDAPIDKMFRAPGAAWLLFAFGVTFAPFFEEFIFADFCCRPCARPATGFTKRQRALLCARSTRTASLDGRPARW